MAKPFRYGPRFHGGTVQTLMSRTPPNPRLTLGECAAVERMHAHRERLREEDPAAYARYIVKAKQTTSLKARRHIPVTLAPVRGMEGC